MSSLLLAAACSEEGEGGADPDHDGGAGGSATGGAGGAGTGGQPDGGGDTDAGDGGDTDGGDTDGGDTDGGSADGGNSDGGNSDGGSADGGGTVIVSDLARLILGRMSPLPDVPPDTTNAFADSDAAATLGQMLFFEKRYSGALKVASDLGAVGDTGTISCASCHSGPGLDDRRSLPSTVSLGADFHSRNAPSAINSSFYPWVNWGGRFDVPWALPLAVSESGVIMNGSRLAVVRLIFDRYRAEYEAAFGPMSDALADTARFPVAGKPKAAGAADGPWEAMTPEDQSTATRVFVNFGKAIEAYLRRLVSRDAPFDRWVAGDESALDLPALRGAELFAGKARCSGCHSGPLMSDGQFHNIGARQEGGLNVPAADDGRFKDLTPLLGSPFTGGSVWSDDPSASRLVGLALPPPESTRGQFRTPTLRGVADTAPYMHAGQLPTLAAVVEHYDQGGATPTSGTLSPLVQPLGLTAEEKADLVAFLEQLTGAPVPDALLADTSKP